MAVYTTNSSSNLKRNYTLDDLENNEEFQQISERFLSSVGEQSDDVYEYLRDSDFNLFSGMQRAMESKDFSQQQKTDYKYLRKRFDNADMGSLKQYAGLAQNMVVDIATDPTAIAALLLAPITGGGSFAGRQAVATTTNQGLKNIALSNASKGITPLQTAGLTALEVGTWSGLDNHFRQTTELNTNMRKVYSNPELVSTTALGAITGGVFGGLARKNEFFEERLQRLYSEDGYRKEAGSDLAYNIRKRKDKILAKSIASPAWILKTDAEFSPNARLLGQKLTSEFSKMLTAQSKTRLGYSYAEDLSFRRGNYKAGYEAAVEDLYKIGRISPEAGMEVLTIMRGGQVKGASAAVTKTAANLRQYFDFIRKDAVDAGIKLNDVENYFPRSWNREAIESNKAVFRQKLIDNDIAPEEEVDDIIKSMLNKQNELYSSHSSLLTQARKFENLDDNKFTEFLDNDLHTVTTNYLMNAAKTIEHKKHFLSLGGDVKVGGKTEAGNLLFFKQSNEQQFIERFIKPIQEDLDKYGRTLSSQDQQNLIDVYKSVTGQVDYFTSETAQAIYDGTKLANAMAYLPLATVSSLSEAFITLGKAPISSAIKGMQEGVANGGQILGREMSQMLKEKHKMSDSEITREMNSVFLSVDESMSDLTNRLSGEGLQNETLKKGARGFYRFNLLIPWTKMVQLAAFSTGKDLIQSNLKQLAKPAGLSASKITRLKGELNDLNINLEQGLEWHKKYGNNITKEARDAVFYKNDIVRGAGRFTNGVILQTGREFATVPLFMTNPKVDIFTQFLRYPTVFGNTVLRNFAKETITDTTANAPKLAAFVLMATNVAKATNYWRATPEQREKMDEGEDWRTNLKAMQRVGLLGPTEYLIRGFEGMAYGQNPLVAGVGVGGPVINDVIGMTLYDRGLFETIARKAPLTGTRNIFDRTVGDIMEEFTGIREPYTPLQNIAKNLDKKIGAGTQAVAEAVTGVDKKTGGIQPFDITRKPYAIGGQIGKGLKPIYSKIDDVLDSGGGASGENTFENLAKVYYEDEYTYSTPLKTLLLDSPDNEKGDKLYRWLQKQKGIKQEELNFLDVENIIKLNPEFSGLEVAEAAVENTVTLKPFIRNEDGLNSKLNFVSEDVSYADNQWLFKDSSNVNISKAKIKEFKKAGEVPNLQKITVEGPQVLDIEAYAIGSPEIGFQYMIENKNLTMRVNSDFSVAGNITEAKLNLQRIMQEETIIDDFSADYGAKHKTYIDGNLPGGRDYKEIVFGLQGNKIIELNYGNKMGFHFDSNDELTQLGHVLTRTRKLLSPERGPGRFKQSFNTQFIDEMQSDTMARGFDYGFDTPAQRKITQKRSDEIEKIKLILKQKQDLIKLTFHTDFKNKTGYSLYDTKFVMNEGEDGTRAIERNASGYFVDSPELREKGIPLKVKTMGVMYDDLMEHFSKIKGPFIKEYNKLDKINLDGIPQLDKFKGVDKVLDTQGWMLGDKHNIKYKDKDLKLKMPNGNLLNHQEYSLNANLNSKIFDDPQDATEIFDSITKQLDNLELDLISLDGEYGNLERLIPDYPMKKEWHKPLLKQMLYMAAKDGQDGLSISSVEVILQRYMGEGEAFKRMLYENKIPSFMKKLANEYGGEYKVMKLDYDNVSPYRTAESRRNAALAAAGDDLNPAAVPISRRQDDYIAGRDAFDYLKLQNAPTIIITPELRKKIIKEKVTLFSKGGLVTGKDDVPYTKEDPANRVDPNTGRPYSDQMARLGLNVGGKIGTEMFKAFHGSAQNFNKFSTAFRGSGEGINAYGKGLYFTDRKNVAEFYKFSVGKFHERKRLQDQIKKSTDANEILDLQDKINRISNKEVTPDEIPGKVYEVDIRTSKADLFDLDTSIKSQKKVIPVVNEIIDELQDNELRKYVSSVDGFPPWALKDESRSRLIERAKKNTPKIKGLDFIDFIKKSTDRKFFAEDALFDSGIKGMKYLDNLSRNKGVKNKTNNYVIFDARIIDISKKYAIPLALAGQILMSIDSMYPEQTKERQQYSQGSVVEDKQTNIVSTALTVLGLQGKGTYDIRLEKQYETDDNGEFSRDENNELIYTHDANVNKTPHLFVQDMYQELLKAGVKHPRLKAVQAGYESKYGMSEVATKANNTYGVKVRGNEDFSFIELNTKEHHGKGFVPEKANFRTYSSIQDNIKGMENFIATGNYGNALKATTDLEYLQEIKNGGYATSPTYVKDISNLLKNYTNMGSFD